MRIRRDSKFRLGLDGAQARTAGACQKARLNGAIQGASLDQIWRLIEYKAANRGGQVIAGPPAYINPAGGACGHAAARPNYPRTAEKSRLWSAARGIGPQRTAQSGARAWNPPEDPAIQPHSGSEESPPFRAGRMSTIESSPSLVLHLPADRSSRGTRWTSSGTLRRRPLRAERLRQETCNRPFRHTPSTGIPARGFR